MSLGLVTRHLGGNALLDSRFAKRRLLLIRILLPGSYAFVFHPKNPGLGPKLFRNLLAVISIGGLLAHGLHEGRIVGKVGRISVIFLKVGSRFGLDHAILAQNFGALQSRPKLDMKLIEAVSGLLKILAAFQIKTVSRSDLLKIIGKPLPFERSVVCRGFDTVDDRLGRNSRAAKRRLDLRDLRALRRLEEIELRAERDRLAEERAGLLALTADEGRQWARIAEQLREVRITRNWLDHAEGSVLVEFGRTRVLVAASFEAGVPRWLKGQGTGWVTAEYEMLPRSTNTRSGRESRKGKVGGRTHEISRLIGRSLRAIIDTKALGENTIVLDCDVLQADGGTRTAAITGAYVALADAIAELQSRGVVPGTCISRCSDAAITPLRRRSSGSRVRALSAPRSL